MLVSFKNFINEKILTESYLDQLKGVIAKTSELVDATEKTHDLDSTHREILGRPLDHKVAGFGTHPIIFSVAPDEGEGARLAGGFRLAPDASPVNARAHLVHLFAPRSTTAHMALRNIKRAQHHLSHELAHSWQAAKQQLKGIVTADGQFKNSGAPFLSRLETQEVIRDRKKLGQIDDFFKRRNPSELDMTRDYLNADTERNARAIEQGFGIFHSYPTAFRHFSKEMPNATHDEVVQRTRSEFLAYTKSQEPTFHQANQSEIARRRAKQYEKQHTKRMMLAIGHAENTHGLRHTQIPSGS
jgi:hypothetical protein